MYGTTIVERDARIFEPKEEFDRESLKGRKDVPDARKVFRVLGVDLGQSEDHAAAVMLELDATEGSNDNLLKVRYIREWETGHAYTLLKDELLDLMPNVIVVEFNGVGRPFVDELRQRAMERSYSGHILPVVTAGSNAKLQEHEEARGRHITVPKTDLITAIILSQEKRRLRFAPCSNGMCRAGHPCGNSGCSQEAPCLRRSRCTMGACKPLCIVGHLHAELASFQRRYSKVNMQYGNEPKAGKHDDLVIAMGLACFYVVRWVRQRRGLGVAW
jgi:hypothetical protein